MVLWHRGIYFQFTCLFSRGLWFGKFGKEIGKQSNYDFKGQNNSDELRIYGMGAQILSEIGVKKMILLTNTEWKFIGLDAYNIEIIQTKFLSTIDE